MKSMADETLIVVGVNAWFVHLMVSSKFVFIVKSWLNF